MKSVNYDYDFKVFYTILKNKRIQIENNVNVTTIDVYLV